MVIKGGVVQTIDEDALRQEVAELMEGFRADFDDVVKSRAAALPHMLDAHRRVWKSEVGLQRFIPRTRR